MKPQDIDWDLLKAAFSRMVESFRKAGEATRIATAQMRMIALWDIREEVEYLRLVARAELAEARLDLDRKMTAMYADLGMVR